MTLPTHGDQKYSASSLLADAFECRVIRIEHRKIGPGRQGCVRPECTEFLHVLSGQAYVRRSAAGETQEGQAIPGTSWLVPAGTDETLMELDGTAECLLVFLPAVPLPNDAFTDHASDTAIRELAYAGGFADPVLGQISTALRGLIGCQTRPCDRLFADGLRTALSAHLVGNYNAERWRPPPKLPTLRGRRLQKVLDHIDTRLAENISLKDLAGEACLSPFHFARLFREATGASPHRYVIDRRIRAAQEMLRVDEASLAEIALDSGFGSQANFSRTFRRIIGSSPGNYREITRETSAGR